ncbi:Major Facilitator Superfamily [Aspergillus sp. HF37]|nr:Major Facilitator Superfamily [Aspergillus sp. HF37]
MEDKSSQENQPVNIDEPRQKASVSDTSSIPNGGLKAWLQVAGTFFVFFNTWYETLPRSGKFADSSRGVLNTFGAYQTYYETQELFSASSSTISWVGSVQSSLLLVLGLLTGPLYDAGYFHVLLPAGSFLIVFGQMMLSISHEYYQVLLAQGFCVGIGAGLIFIPGVAILSTYFDKKLAIANGIAAAGSGVGAIIYPIVFHRLYERIGFGWTTRAIGLIILVSLSPLLLFRVRVQQSGGRKLIDWPAFKEPAYVSFISGGILVYITLNIPFYYISSFAISHGIAHGDLAFYLLPIITTGSVFGRIVPNLFAHKVGPFNIVFVCAVICGALMFALIDLSNLGGLIVVALLYGFFSGAFVSLPPTCFVKLSPNRSLIGTRMGMGYAVMMIGNLIGTPIAGAILEDGGFNSVWILAGVTSIAGGFGMFLSRNFQGGWKILVLL